MQIINLVAFGLLVGGLTANLLGRKRSELFFLPGTLLLTITALSAWWKTEELPTLAFALLFSVQVVANVLVLGSVRKSRRDFVVLGANALLFALFTAEGLLQDQLFLAMALGTVASALGYAETNAKHQAKFFLIGGSLELWFAGATGQMVYVWLNAIFIAFATAIIIRR